MREHWDECPSVFDLGKGKTGKIGRENHVRRKRSPL